MVNRKHVDPKSVNFQTDDLSQLSSVELGIALEKGREQLETRVEGKMRAYLVSLELPEENPDDIQESMQELGALVRSLGDECVGALVQKRPKVNPATFIGEGKAEIIKESAVQLKVDYVVFDKELSPSQVRNLEAVIQRPVLDRTDVILQIFRKNAKTREAKTQVEIVRLEYMLSRVSNSWVTFERQRGGSGARLKGAGEAQLELDKRRLKDKIASLKKELEKIEKERNTQRKQRRNEWKIVLVGYTNAGKTSIMNALTDSQLSAKDALFETLDSAVRILKSSVHPKILITDTVGFIRNLPHKLVASFRSTLEEAAVADLLLHVVDVSHPKYREHIQVTNDVLQEVGAGDVPRMMIYNKADQLKSEPRLNKILTRGTPNSLVVSSSRPEDMEKLRSQVIEYFSQHMCEVTLKVPYQDAEKMRLIHAFTRVLDTRWEEDFGVFHVRINKSFLERYFQGDVYELASASAR